MTKTLKITGREELAWEILGELAGLYGDNGGDPDGNAWLPSEPITEKEAREVLAAGLGEMVDVLYADDATVFDWLGLEETTHAEEMKEAMNREAAWAHYGAYGAMGSVWVFAPATHLFRKFR